MNKEKTVKHSIADDVVIEIHFVKSSVVQYRRGTTVHTVANTHSADAE